MTRLLLALGVLWGMAGCSGTPPANHSTTSPGATTLEPRVTSPYEATARTPPVKPDPG